MKAVTALSKKTSKWWRIVPFEKSVAGNPILSKEYSLRNPLPADQVYAGTSKKLWWDCQVLECGYQWQETGNHRVGSKNTPGVNCPACANKVVTPKNSLAFLFPDLAKEYSSDNPKSASEIYAYSHTRVKWDCFVCSCRWTTEVKNRTKNKSGCPGCDGKVATINNNLTVTHSHLHIEYSYRNEKPAFQVITGTHKILEWDCSMSGCFNKWQATGLSRKRGGVCPACKGKGVTSTNNLQYVYPEIAVEFSEMNFPLTAKTVVALTSKKFWWRHSKCGHECRETIKAHLEAKSCSICDQKALDDFNEVIDEDSDNQQNLSQPISLAQVYPHLVEEYSLQNDIPADKLFDFEDKMVIWENSDCGHSWQARVSSRINGDIGCPQCFKSRRCKKK